MAARAFGGPVEGNGISGAVAVDGIKGNTQRRLARPEAGAAQLVGANLLHQSGACLEAPGVVRKYVAHNGPALSRWSYVTSEGQGVRWEVARIISISSQFGRLIR